ncbi:unnamed protein product [Symbiodinium sp. CCMP2592]|nr:unnamed protein product [Symbiodinium sp. CCMP2592]
MPRRSAFCRAAAALSAAAVGTALVPTRLCLAICKLLLLPDQLQVKHVFVNLVQCRDLLR